MGGGVLERDRGAWGSGCEAPEGAGWLVSAGRVRQALTWPGAGPRVPGRGGVPVFSAQIAWLPRRVEGLALG
jgi:hypothetical protein